MTSAHALNSDALLHQLIQAARVQPISLIRGPESDPVLIYVRTDLAVWGDESRARQVNELNAAELAWVGLGIEHPAAESKDFLAEASHWRRVPGFFEWLQGGPHPHDILGTLACGWRRGQATPELNARQVILGGRTALAPADRFEALDQNQQAREAALMDPERTIRSWEFSMSNQWCTAEFEAPILFLNDALPAIAPGATLCARARRDGSWIFEHPDVEGWLCMMRTASRPVSQHFFHSGCAPVEI